MKQTSSVGGLFPHPSNSLQLILDRSWWNGTPVPSPLRGMTLRCFTETPTGPQESWAHSSTCSLKHLYHLSSLCWLTCSTISTSGITFPFNPFHSNHLRIFQDNLRLRPKQGLWLACRKERKLQSWLVFHIYEPAPCLNVGGEQNRALDGPRRMLSGDGNEK